jgi:glycosyltransferase involved in cell wall biosynthesis
VADIPRHVEGIDEVEILVVDDGSTDRTAEVARRAGVDHVVRHKRNCGLARAFRTGIDASLRLGADLIVNTDGDNQYAGAEIPKLIAPILAGQADMVIGDRQTWNIPHFSRTKRILQAIGSFAVRKLSRTNVPDAVSGFRAFSRDAALQMNVVSAFSYTIETIIQARKKSVTISSVPVATNRGTRKSRLFRSVPQFLSQSFATLVRVYAMYQPLRVFFYLSIVLSLIGIIPIGRFLYFYFTGSGAGHVQSLVLGGVALLMGFVTLMIGMIADLVSFNRQLIEMILEKVRRLELAQQSGEGEDSRVTRTEPNEDQDPQRAGYTSDECRAHAPSPYRRKGPP